MDVGAADNSKRSNLGSSCRYRQGLKYWRAVCILIKNLPSKLFSEERSGEETETVRNRQVPFRQHRLNRTQRENISFDLSFLWQNRLLVFKQRLQSSQLKILQTNAGGLNQQEQLYRLLKIHVSGEILLLKSNFP